MKQEGIARGDGSPSKDAQENLLVVTRIRNTDKEQTRLEELLCLVWDGRCPPYK